MPITPANSHKCSDGRLFEDRDAAKDHEFELQLRAWWATNGFTADPILNKIIEDRRRLLAVFKELNGGSTITAPRHGDLRDHVGGQS